VQTLLKEEQELLESYEFVEWLKSVYPFLQSAFKFSLESFLTGIRSLGREVFQIYKKIKDYDWSNIQTDLNSFIKLLLKLQSQIKNLKEDAGQVVLDLIRTIMSSRIFWIVLFIFLLSNVFGAISSIVAAKGLIATSTAIAGQSITTVNVAAMTATISSATSTAFVNSFLAAGAALVAVFKK